MPQPVVIPSLNPTRAKECSSMCYRHRNGTRLCRTATCIVIVTLANAWARGAEPHGCVRCPRCNWACELQAETVAETEHCWQIESVPICVPRVTFPWEKRCHHCGTRGCTAQTCGLAAAQRKGAKVKCVRRLVKKEYECQRCEYEWSPKRLPCCGPPGSCGDKDANAEGAEGSPAKTAPPELNSTGQPPVPAAPVPTSRLPETRQDNKSNWIDLLLHRAH